MIRISQLFIFAIFICCIALPATAKEQALLYYILDGSGSMWGKTGGEVKIEVAKKVMIQLIKEMPDTLDSGLTVYGHRRKGDCKDIEALIPAGIIDRELAISKVSSISPKGKTPITDSILQTAETLKHRETESTIVLVSDGIETCEKDPCAATRSLKKHGIKFKIHVIGFGMSDQNAEQLACIAEAGDGQYFSAENADQLISILKSVKQSVIDNVPLSVPKSEKEHTVTPQAVEKDTIGIEQAEGDTVEAEPVERYTIEAAPLERYIIEAGPEVR